MSNVQAVRTVDYQNDTGTEAFLFPHGMAGFPEDTRYGFLYEGRGDIVCMQSLDNIAASFLMTPWDEARLGAPPAALDHPIRVGNSFESEVLVRLIRTVVARIPTGAAP